MSQPNDRAKRRGVRDLSVLALAHAGLWLLATPGPLRLGGAELGPSYAVRAVVASAAVLGLAVLLIVGAARDRREMAGLRPPAAPRAWVEALALVPVLGIVLYLVVDPSPFVRDYPWPSVSWLAGGSDRWLLWSAGYAVYYLAYEAFFRGAVLAWSERRMNRSLANLLQTVLSTLVHLGKPWPEVVAAFPAGLAFGWLRFRWGSVLPVAVVHLAIGLTLDLALVTTSSP